MKKILVTAMACMLMLANIATADHTQLLGGGLPSGGQFFGGSFNVVGDPVDGLEVSFDWSGTGASWASDMQFEITGPSGSSWVIGGYDNLGSANQDWDFQGFGSASPGFYSHTVANPFNSNNNGTTLGAGTWNWRMTNDWAPSDPVSVTNLTVTLSQVPEPTSLALVGMTVMGLTFRRRRR